MISFFMILWAVVAICLVTTVMHFDFGRDEEESFNYIICAAFWPISITVLMLIGVFTLIKDIFHDRDRY